VCPECAYAARQLLTPTIKKHLEDQIQAGNKIVCVSVVPAGGITTPGACAKFVPVSQQSKIESSRMEMTS
jgi:hypothetical protein